MSLSKKPPASVPNRWLSNLIRPRASSFSVETCLNLTDADPSTPLDARPLLPLLANTQALQIRCKHLKSLSELCKNYKFSHLENVFFTVQDILESPMPKEARHTVFEFMLACIHGQYDELGMARVTFYSSLKTRDQWEDFTDMYNVLFALCKGGRDISGFEKNIAKLLMTWITMALERMPSPPPKNTPIDHLSNVLHLLTLTGKFNFAMFEELEVADMISVVRKAFQASSHLEDIYACMEFTDIVVRYRFVPFEALKTFLEILCESVVLPEEDLPTGSLSVWSIFMNLLRSHCAHNAILTLCKFLDSPVVPVLAQGAMQLLSEAAWGVKVKTGAETYMVPDTVLLMYIKRATLQPEGLLHATILGCLSMLIENPENKLGLLEWDAIWDCVDNCTAYILTLDIPLKDILESKQDKTKHYEPTYHFVLFLENITKQYSNKSYLGPLPRFMSVLYTLRNNIPEDMTGMLLDYYETEHVLLPSAENWLDLLLDVITTFFVPSTVSFLIRNRVLGIVKGVYDSVKDFYAEEMYIRIITPMMTKIAQETNTDLRQDAVNLLVNCLLDCQDAPCFDTMLSLLSDCARCRCFHEPKTQAQSLKEEVLLSGLRRSQSQSYPSSHRLHSPLLNMPRSTTVSPASSPMIPYVAKTDGYMCTGLSAANGFITIFGQFLYGDSTACAKAFQAITDLANNSDDLMCPSGGVKLSVLDLLLRLRCPSNHRIYVIHQDADDPNITLLRKEKDEKTPQSVQKTANTKQDTSPYMRAQPSLSVLSYLDEHTDKKQTVVLPMDEVLKAYIKTLSHCSDWNIAYFVLKRLPTQLSNKHLFCGATDQIHKLRRCIVKWISTRKFLENVISLPPTVKRNDLNRYAYDILTMLISYRWVFSKQEQDEIVYAFYIGITQVTASTKPCINALNLCCHELPLSVAKMISEILQRMSQIISVSSVSVHILEFLSALARLPNLYANFTSDMYKPVFAIALNYLQHSHTVTQTQSTSSTPVSSPMLGSPVSSTPPVLLMPKEPPPPQQQGAMAQYVLIMAYLVITVWFTSMPLRERRKHITFIIQRLLGGNPPGKPIDEQIFTCIDMLSRFSFADISLSPKKSLVTNVLMEEMPGAKNSRTWVYGHTLLTLKTSKVVGWVEATIRRPSGTFSMMCNIQNKIKSEEVDYKTLPAMLMMQNQLDVHNIAAEVMAATEEEGVFTLPEEDALGISFQEMREEETKINGSNSRRPSEHGMLMNNAAHHRLDGLTMSPMADSESVKAPESYSRRPSLSQKGFLDLLSSNKSTPDQNTRKEAEDKKGFMIREIMEDLPSVSQSASSIRKTDQWIDPGLIYLQLYNYPDITRLMDAPPLLPDDDATLRTLATLDRIPVVDFHKIGVLYVGPRQNHEVQILANTHGSPDYIKFLHGLGTIEKLCGRTDNTGGLDREMDIDGRHAYFWKDDVTEMIFHVATMMPTHLDRDPQCSAKKRHIGNDYVSIVYNDSGTDYTFNTLPGQFNFVNIVISPHSISSESVATQALWGTESSFFRVEMQRRPDMPDIGPISEPKLISAQSLPGFVRQVALHANIFAQVQSGANGKREYVAHWRERLRHIRRVRDRAMAAPTPAPGKTKEHTPLDLLLDFTRYT